MKNAHQFNLVITDRFSMLIEAIMTTKMTAITVAATFINHFIGNMRIPYRVLTNNRPRFTPKDFGKSANS